MTDTPVDERRLKRALDLVLEHWDAHGVIDAGDGILHLPTTLKRRTKDGGLSEVAVLLRPVTNLHRIRSRSRAREWALKLKLDLDRDRDLVDELENYEILAFALRDPETRGQHQANAEELFALYDQMTLSECWGTYTRWLDLLDPRFGEMSSEDIWRVIVAVKETRSMGPLAAIASYEQIACILSMAEEACNSTRAPSWVHSPERSTPAPSAPMSSEPSSESPPPDGEG